MTKQHIWAAFAFLLAIIIVATIFNLSSRPLQTNVGRRIPYSSFITDLDSGKVARVTLRGAEISGRFRDNVPFHSSAPSAHVEELTNRLLAKGVEVKVSDAEEFSLPRLLVEWVLPYAIFFGGIWWFLTRPILAVAQKLDALVDLAREK